MCTKPSKTCRKISTFITPWQSWQKILRCIVWVRNPLKKNSDIIPFPSWSFLLVLRPPVFFSSFIVREASRFPEACVSERPTFLISWFSKMPLYGPFPIVYNQYRPFELLEDHHDVWFVDFWYASSIHANNAPPWSTTAFGCSVSTTSFHAEKPKMTQHSVSFWWFLTCFVWIIELLGSDQNRRVSTSCWYFWWPLWQCNDASVTAEHHTWEFLNSFRVLVLANPRPANCDSLLELSQSSTSANYSRFLEACSQDVGVLVIHVFRSVTFGPLEAQVVFCEQFSFPSSLTTFTAHTSSVETGI